MLLLVMILLVHVTAERLLDLSYPIGENSQKYIGYRPFERSRFHKGWQPNGVWVESFDVAFSEHTSTHMDAPIHTAYGKNTVDEIPIEDLLGPAIVIDMEDKAAKDDNAALGMDDLQKWTAKYGPLPDRVIIFVRTGWGARYHNRTAYFGTDTNDTSKLRFPGLGAEVSEYLAGLYNETGRRVLGVGIDTMSLDTGNSTTFPAHLALSAENIYLLENVANLQDLPPIGAEVTVLPIKFTKGTGGPTRILARIPDSIASNTPTSAPANTPTSVPSNTPTSVPSNTPTSVPSNTPTSVPSNSLTSVPSNTPTSVPSNSPNSVPSNTPAPIHSDNAGSITPSNPSPSKSTHTEVTSAFPDHSDTTSSNLPTTTESLAHPPNTPEVSEQLTHPETANENSSSTKAEPEHAVDIDTEVVLPDAENRQK